MVGSMRTGVADGQTDGQTDGAGYIGPAGRQGGSKKCFLVKFEPHFAVFRPQYFLDCWHHLNLLNTIAVYQNMQYQKKLISKSQENEFGDQSNLENSLKKGSFLWVKYFLTADTTRLC